MVAAEAVAVAMAVAKTSCSARLLLDDHFTELLLHTRHRQPEQVCQALHRHARVACCDDLDVVLGDARVERLEHERALRHGELGVPEGGKLGGESVLELREVKISWVMKHLSSERHLHAATGFNASSHGTVEAAGSRKSSGGSRGPCRPARATAAEDSGTFAATRAP